MVIMAVSWPKELEGLPPSSVEWICREIGLELQQDRTDLEQYSRRLWCGNCSRFHLEVKTGMFSCPGCGVTEYGYVVDRPTDRTAVVRKVCTRNHAG